MIDDSHFPVHENDRSHLTEELRRIAGLPFDDPGYDLHFDALLSRVETNPCSMFESYLNETRTLSDIAFSCLCRSNMDEVLFALIMRRIFDSEKRIVERCMRLLCEIKDIPSIPWNIIEARMSVSPTCRYFGVCLISKTDLSLARSEQLLHQFFTGPDIIGQIGALDAAAAGKTSSERWMIESALKCSRPALVYRALSIVWIWDYADILSALKVEDLLNRWTRHRRIVVMLLRCIKSFQILGLDHLLEDHVARADGSVALEAAEAAVAVCRESAEIWYRDSLKTLNANALNVFRAWFSSDLAK